MTGHATGPAAASLWANARFVVVDVETCQAPDGDHIVALAAVTCRSGRISGAWSTLVNPGVPIDAFTSSIHGITDEHVQDEAGFDVVSDRLITQLAPIDAGEQVVLVAHNVGFDVARLHLEATRLGKQLPDVLIADTMTLTEHLGVAVPDRKLITLLAALGLTNPAHHDALTDAYATAQALVALLNLAVRDGVDDLPALLEQVAPRRYRTGQIRPAASRSGRPARSAAADGKDVPAGHAATHANVLPAEPTDAELAEWRDQVDACIELRCELLTDRVTATDADPSVLRLQLEQALAEAISAGDRAATATVLHSLSPLLAELPDRRAAERWWDRWASPVVAVGRCDTDDPCASCRLERPCPVDVWHHDLAIAALGKPHLAKTFLPTSGERAGTGVFATWRSKGRRRLADRVAYLTWRYWRDSEQPSKADTVARYAWDGGGREPRLVNVYAGLIAASGTPAALQRGIDVCDQALAGRNGDTDDGWQQLLVRRSQLAGRLARSRPSAPIGLDGDPLERRRHHPAAPKRTRRTRFTVT